MRSYLVPGLYAFCYSYVAIIYSEGSYVLGSSKKEDIIIAKKYTYVKNGSTNFMVIDTNGRHFNVDNCLYYWNWNTIEDWGNLKLLEQRQINYYSYRVPFLGMYPTIVEFSKRSDEKRSDEKQIKSDEKQIKSDEKQSDEKRSDEKQIKSDEKRSDKKRIKSDEKQIERGDIIKHIHL